MVRNVYKSQNRIRKAQCMALIYLFILHYTCFACIYGNASIITINNLLKFKKKTITVLDLHELRIIVYKDCPNVLCVFKCEPFISGPAHLLLKATKKATEERDHWLTASLNNYCVLLHKQVMLASNGSSGPP